MFYIIMNAISNSVKEFNIKYKSIGGFFFGGNMNTYLIKRAIKNYY